MQLRRSLIATGMVAALAVAGVSAAVANDPPPRIAFLANGIVPADALAAGPIAGQLGAPIYTTAPGFLVEGTGVALDAYDPELVIVMGGPAAISDAVLTEVADVTGLSIEDSSPPPTSGIVRAAGQDRFETAAAAAALLGSYDPAFLPTDMKAADSDLLDGKDSSAFQPAGDYLGRTDKATDADELDGRDSSAFLGATEKAADSQLLDGLDVSQIRSRVWAETDDTLAGTTQLSAGHVTVNSVDIDVPADGVLVLSGTAYVNSYENTTTSYTLQVQVDGEQVAPPWAAFFDASADGEAQDVGQMSYTVTVPITAGHHSVSQTVGPFVGGPVDFFHNNENLTATYHPGGAASVASQATVHPESATDATPDGR